MLLCRTIIVNVADLEKSRPDASSSMSQTSRMFNALRQFVVSKRCARISRRKRCARISPSKRCVRISLSKRCVCISPPLEGRGRGGVFDPKVGYLSQRLFLLCFSNMTFSALWVWARSFGVGCSSNFNRTSEFMTNYMIARR